MRPSRIWIVAGGGWAGRGIQVLAQLAAIRILTDSLGTNGYGVFAVLGSLTGWFMLSDFSIAIGLQNHISEARAAERDGEDAIFTATILSALSSGSVALAMLLLGPWLSEALLGAFGGLTPAGRTLAFYAMAFPGIGTAFGGVAYKIWFAQHRGYLSNLMPAIGTVVGTVAVWLVARAHVQPMLQWSIFLYYAPLALLPMGSLALIALRRRRHRFRLEIARPLLGRAARFWLFGIAAAAVLQVDYIILAQVLPAREIVIYNVASKIFQLVFFVYNALLLALWPVCSEAIARGEWKALLRQVRRYVAIGLLFTLACGAGLAILNPVVVRIVAPSLREPLPLIVIVLLTVYVGVRVWTDTFGMMLQSMNDLKPLWIAVPLQSLLSIVLQTLGARWFGLPGMIVGLTLCFVLTVGWILPLRIRHHVHRGATTL